MKLGLPLESSRWWRVSREGMGGEEFEGDRRDRDGSAHGDMWVWRVSVSSISPCVASFSVTPRSSLPFPPSALSPAPCALHPHNLCARTPSSKCQFSFRCIQSAVFCFVFRLQCFSAETQKEHPSYESGGAWKRTVHQEKKSSPLTRCCSQTLWPCSPLGR